MAKAIPGLRPWEVLSVEQAMDQITYSGKWYREPLGSFTTGPPYIQLWNEEVEVILFASNNLISDYLSSYFLPIISKTILCGCAVMELIFRTTMLEIVVRVP